MQSRIRHYVLYVFVFMYFYVRPLMSYPAIFVHSAGVCVYMCVYCISRLYVLLGLCVCVRLCVAPLSLKALVV